MAHFKVQFVNPDLQKERDGATIDPEELTCLIFGGPELVAKRRKIEDLACNDPDYQTLPLEFLSREEQYEECLRRSALVVKKRPTLGNLVKDYEDMQIYIECSCHANALYGLNYLMFIPTIEGQGTEEQKAKWLPLALNHKIIGTYAQTEMGHGTFLRGLETTAQYDPSTQEFIINSPTISSIKWWPGSSPSLVREIPSTSAETKCIQVVVYSLIINRVSCNHQYVLIPLKHFLPQLQFIAL